VIIKGCVVIMRLVVVAGLLLVVLLSGCSAQMPVIARSNCQLYYKEIHSSDNGVYINGNFSDAVAAYFVMTRTGC